MKHILSILAVTLLFASCKTLKQPRNSEPIQVVALPELTIQEVDRNAKTEVADYQASNKRVNDLLHTKLDVKFDWEKQYLYGNAELTFKPYFYSTNELVLDAKGMDIKSVILIDTVVISGFQYLTKHPSKIDLKYTYDGMKITIDLGKTYTRKETYTIKIDYTAKPNEIEASGSSAITDEKGLYFINPLGTDPKKMPQIWTQGETEASSCWFPTIDSPNEKTTQEISITVKDKYLTLSNGKMISSTKNADGTRTDYWKQDLKHAPYLFMMAVGEFDITKDSWTRPDGRKMEVNYYTEPEYTPYAKAIFGKTPKMIQFFSDKLGVEYAWDKYNQIVVRDYVSGAMENTTAVIHGDFLYQTDRELLDSDNESIIAHELFHHWFGDLVTCESWSNLTVNESFANYSQYLWDEFEHGKVVADRNAFGEMSGYFLSSGQSGYHDLVYFDYESEMEMFDGTSYNKGGRVLHMLRNYVGDEAFFLSLKHYLDKKRFGTGESHDLRLSFEEVTGEDMNWFFNQWYFDKGHPTLNFTQEYDEITKKLTVTVEQRQDLEKFPVFQLPIGIDIYTKGGIERKNITVTKTNQSFDFYTETPLLVNIDADKVLLCKKTEEKSMEQWIYQLNNAPLYLDKKEAFAKVKNSKDTSYVNAVFGMLEQPHYDFNNMAMGKLSELKKQQPEKLKATLLKLTTNKKSSVRANAYKNLEGYFGEDAGHEKLLAKGLKDNSYKVIGVCLGAFANNNPEKAMEVAKDLENEKSNAVSSVLASLYADHGTKENHDFFKNAISNTGGFAKYGLLNQYSSYLSRLDEKDISDSYEVYENVISTSSTWWIKMGGYQGLLAAKNRMTNRISELNTELSTVSDLMKKSKIEREINDYKVEIDKINSVYKKVKSAEKDNKVIDYLKNM